VELTSQPRVVLWQLGVHEVDRNIDSRVSSLEYEAVYRTEIRWGSSETDLFNRHQKAPTHLTSTHYDTKDTASGNHTRGVNRQSSHALEADAKK
jgi:hypothetical protein